MAKRPIAIRFGEAADMSLVTTSLQRSSFGDESAPASRVPRVARGSVALVHKSRLGHVLGNHTARTVGETSLKMRPKKVKRIKRASRERSQGEEFLVSRQSKSGNFWQPAQHLGIWSLAGVRADLFGEPHRRRWGGGGRQKSRPLRQFDCPSRPLGLRTSGVD